MYIYIQNVNSNTSWTATFEPYNEIPDKYRVVFSRTRQSTIEGTEISKPILRLLFLRKIMRSQKGISYQPQ
jgi:hypothetical protein